MAVRADMEQGMNLRVGGAVAASLAVILGGVSAADAAVTRIEQGQPTVNVAEFDTGSDRYNIFADTFGVVDSLVFQNVFADSGNVIDGANVIVLQNSDNDSNAGTVFNARSAAGVIAGNTGADRAGFFVYFNSALNINRLVFSTNLNDSLALLTILAANLSPVGADAIAQLPTFSERNFEFSEVPIPGALPLFLAGLGLSGFAAARRSKEGPRP